VARRQVGGRAAGKRAVSKRDAVLIRASVARILASEFFARAKNIRKILEFIVTEELAGRRPNWKGEAIAPGRDSIASGIVRTL